MVRGHATRLEVTTSTYAQPNAELAWELTGQTLAKEAAPPVQRPHQEGHQALGTAPHHLRDQASVRGHVRPTPPVHASAGGGAEEEEEEEEEEKAAAVLRVQHSR